MRRTRDSKGAQEVRFSTTNYCVTLADLVAASDRDFELRWEPVPSRMPQSALFTEQLDGETYALMMLLPPTVPVAPVPRELILVIDHSGSMHGVSMAQAREAADRALARLRPDDRFNVIVFDDSTESLFPAPVPADPAIVAQARAWVRGIESEGGTEMLPALRAAFAGAPAPGYLRQVVLATDAAVGNEDELFRVIETERGQARVFPVGIGSAPNGHFLRKAAELGRGSQVLIRDVNEVTERMDALLARLDQPAMRDLTLNLPAGAEVYPQALPDLYAGEPLQVVARLPVPKGTAQLHGLARDRAWSASLPLARGSVHSPGVGRLWARARIDALEDARRAGAPEDETRAGILEVALRHGLVSRYTSLVAVERTPVRPLEAGLASTQFANATRDGLAFAQGGTSARAELLLALLLALSALALVRLRH